jgi:S1-C subfamily serine protease
MTDVLESFSQALAEAVDKAGHGVVQIKARRRLPASGIVWSSEGVLITANHVVERDDRIEVQLADGKKIKAELAGRDATTDVAVLRLKAKGLTPLEWADLDGLSVGHLVLGLGRPRGDVMASLGIVSKLADGLQTRAGGRVEPALQTDLVMYPGFSGGALIDASGRLLGMNTSAFLRGASMAIPTRTLDRVAESLLEHGRVRRAYLGIGAQPVRLPEDMAQAAGQETGLLAVSVEPGSPADQGGLLLGDALFGLDGEKVAKLEELLSLLSDQRVGKKVPVSIVRAGKQVELTVTLGERK